MSQPKIQLSNIRIASPCSQKWEEMVGDERKRFCAQCQLPVYNFAAMTQVEVESLLMKAEGRVCGRIFQRTDGTILTQDCPVGLRAVRRRVGRMVTAAFSTILGLFTSQTAFAQQPPNEAKVSIQRNLRRYDQAAMQGTVYDLMRAVIAGAEVAATHQQTRKSFITKSDENGRFRFPDLPASQYELLVHSPGFIHFTITELQLTDEDAITLDTTLKVGGEVMGDIIEVKPALIPTNDTRLPTTLIRKDKPRE